MADSAARSRPSSRSSRRPRSRSAGRRSPGCWNVTDPGSGRGCACCRKRGSPFRDRPSRRRPRSAADPARRRPSPVAFPHWTEEARQPAGERAKRRGRSFPWVMMRILQARSGRCFRSVQRNPADGQSAQSTLGLRRPASNRFPPGALSRRGSAADGPPGHEVRERHVMSPSRAIHSRLAVLEEGPFAVDVLQFTVVEAVDLGLPAPVDLLAREHPDRVPTARPRVGPDLGKTRRASSPAN